MPAPDRAHIQRANEAIYAAWNAHDPDAVAAIYADQAELIDPPGNADRWIVTAVHSGEFAGLAATGDAIRVAGCTFSHFDEHGLVDRDGNFWDVAALMSQLSVSPP